jgi:hypothetical protein
VKIKYLKSALSALTVSLLLSACATTKVQPENIQMVAPPSRILTAIGYGTVDKSDKFSRSQIRLMAMRAAKMDAYRALTEQIYGLKLDGKTTVENMVVTHDSYRAFINAYLRGARVTRVTATNTDPYAGDDTFETALEIDLTPRFYECLKGGSVNNQCVQQ